ncbi:MAG TPA: TetR/AcrR family transcriptional regulator [Chryseosolibacter sp.]
MPKSDNKSQLILETALRLFASQGYSATPISQIAKEAGVSQGLMYNFYSSKGELLRSVMQQGSADIAESMKAYSTVSDPREAIRVHVNATIRIIRKKKEFWRLLHALRLQGAVLGEVQHLFAEIVTMVTKIFGKVFGELGFENPKLEAQLFLTQIDGIVIMYLQNEKFPIQQLGNQLIKRYTK